MRLEGKTAVVTGAGGGIGAALAEQLMSAGCRVAALDLRFPDKDGTAGSAGMGTGTGESAADADGAAASDGSGGKRYIRISVDITDEAALRNAEAEIRARFGPAEIVINNAALQTESDFFTIRTQDFRRVVETNLFGTFLVSRVFAEQMPSGSTILCMLSVHHSVPRLGKFAYDASKAGTAMLMREMALALAEREITVNGISFGAVRTPMNHVFQEHPEVMEAARAKVPLRWVAEPEEIAAFSISVLRDFADLATGSIFTVDGGRSLR